MDQSDFDLMKLGIQLLDGRLEQQTKILNAMLEVLKDIQRELIELNGMTVHGKG